HLDRSLERAVGARAPGGERAVAAVRAARGGERVRARLDAAPVVAGGDGDGVDAVHDALVVRRRAVRIELGEARRRDDAVAHARAVELAVGQKLDGNARLDA